MPSITRVPKFYIGTREGYPSKRKDTKFTLRGRKGRNGMAEMANCGAIITDYVAIIHLSFTYMRASLWRSSVSFFEAMAA